MLPPLLSASSTSNYYYSFSRDVTLIYQQPESSIFILVRIFFFDVTLISLQLRTPDI